MQLIDGYNGGIPHIDAQMIRDHHLSLYGTGDYVLDIGNKFNYEIVNNNEIKIYDGYAMMQGARVSIGYGQSVMVTIENGTSGYNRNDIICIKYTRDEETLIEKIAPEVVKGTMSSSTAADPTIVTGNIRSGAISHQMKLYRVRLSGTNIIGVDKLFFDADLGGYGKRLETISTDYVIERKVENGFTVEKWASGKLVQYKRVSAALTFTISGNLAISNSYAFVFPETFVALQSVQITAQRSTGDMNVWAGTYGNADNQTHAARCIVVSNSLQSANIVFSIYGVGTWK